MPKTEPTTLSDVSRAKRARLKKLYDERIVLGYGFSYEKLAKLLNRLGVTSDRIPTELEKCVVACDGPTQKAKTKELSEQISAIYAEENITSLRDTDPFGHPMDCMMFESKSSYLDRGLLITNAPTFGLPVAQVSSLIKASMVSKPYAVLTVRAVSSQDEGEETETAAG